LQLNAFVLDEFNKAVDFSSVEAQEKFAKNLIPPHPTNKKRTPHSQEENLYQ
jgi:hypothetical protein